LTLLAKVLEWIGYGVLTIAGIVAAALLLRVVVSWATRNPFAWLPYHLRRMTEPLVVPLRDPFGRQRIKFELLPLVAAVLVFGIGSFISYTFLQTSTLVSEFSKQMSAGMLTGRFLASFLIALLGLGLQVAIFLRFFLPWFGFGYSSPTMRFLFKVTEPILRPIRRALGQFLVRGALDFTPLLALLLLQFLTPILSQLVR
jgi:YggT family protein